MTSKPSLTPQQEQAVSCPSSVVVTAGAGTGKTYLLTQRYLYYLQKQDISPLEIVAVTFTEKAALELRSRIRSLITTQLAHRSDYLAELEAAQISTIHALSSRICRDQFQLLDIPADFQVLEELEGKLWLNDRFKEVMAQLPSQFFEHISYSKLSSVLETLLDDPYTSEKALKQRIDWEELVQEVRKNALQGLISQPQWENTLEVLQTYYGKAGDKLEDVRQMVLEAMFSLEQGENVSESLRVLDKGINTGKGSKKNWDADHLDLIKETLRLLRDEVYRKFPQKEFLTLELGEADQQLKLMLPAVQKAYHEVYTRLQELKKQARILTYNDLELYALKALEFPKIQEYYKQRWTVFLVDEFQDTNPTQATLLQRLTSQSQLTIVGDKKQAIYGFRRADVTVFDEVSDRIFSEKGQEVLLNQSFRTHSPLLNQINHIFAPLFGNLHQPLTSSRLESPCDLPSIEVFTLPDEKEVALGDKKTRRKIEARFLAETIQEKLSKNTLIWDKTLQKKRPIQPQDIAILTRTWSPLNTIAEILTHWQIPVILTKGESLLETREAKDGYALLRFLADPQDSIALVALLRSPFFTISDRILAQLAQTQPRKKADKLPWWSLLNQAKPPELTPTLDILHQLLQKRGKESPSRILQWCDRLTGYKNTIQQQPNSLRRLADWQGFREFVQKLEQGTDDIFGVVRRLKRIIENQLKVPRPLIEAENTVSLMTIHASKGLEWPMVILADLTRDKNNDTPSVYTDPNYGIAIAGKEQHPVLYHYLKQQQIEKETAETRRLLYVGLTRARDWLLLTAPSPTGHELDLLRPGLTQAGIPLQTLPYHSENAPQPSLTAENDQTPPTPPDHALIGFIGSGLFELPVTALSIYSRCPKRFEYQFIDGHPGLGEGNPKAMRLGSLTHLALEENITQPQKLTSYLQEDWEKMLIPQALELAQTFWKNPCYQPFREVQTRHEERVSFQLEGIQFNGIVDLVGEDWILDYKTDEIIAPEHHQFQLWSYAHGLQAKHAYIAYLRQGKLHDFTAQLPEIGQAVKPLIREMKKNHYPVNPSVENCSICPYHEICEFSEDF